MAVSPQIPGLTVSVKVAGERAKEYDASRQPTTQQRSAGAAAKNNPGQTIPPADVTRCYIESISGLSYAVEVEVAAEFNLVAPYDHLIVQVSIDGKWADSRNIFIGGKKPSRPTALTVDESWIKTNVPGEFRRSKFMFAPVSAIEDASQETVKRDIEVAKRLGTIRVEVYIANGKKRYLYKGNEPVEGEAFKLAEKSMKGRELTHGTRLSAGYLYRSKYCTSFRYERFVGEFEFMYRSRSALQNEMLVPPSQPPSPPADDSNNIDKMGEEQLRRFARELARSFRLRSQAGA